MKQPLRKLAILLQPVLLLALVSSIDTSLRGRELEITPRLNLPFNRTRKLLDGTEACSNCPAGTHQCIGRSVSDEVCGPCASGKTFWPCNVENECWCWDTSGPKDPGDEDSTTVCKGCSGPTESCIANANSLIPADDESCAGCATGQKYWPCDVDGLCWCWDSTKPKKPPAPSSGLEVTNSGKGACDIFTQEMFDEFAPNNTFPYTYEGFCEAVDDYNLYHEEKVFMMGTEDDQRNELAAFLGNTAHESDDYEAGREYLACADNVEVDGKTYCKPCTNDLFDWKTMTCTQSMADLDSPYSEYCQPVFVPPEGCNCETITQVASEGELAGYVDASKVFYGRGAIQLSWNYNYIKASLALTGEPETFCENPELVVSDPKYAWGSAIYFWMESEKEGDTCHKEALKHNFGGTVNVINGGLECPAYAGGWHHKAVKMRINRYCHASLILQLDEIGSMKGCKGMDDSLEECLQDGTCPYCNQMNGGEYIHVSDIDDDIMREGEEEPITDDETPDIQTDMNNATMLPSAEIEKITSNAPTSTSVTRTSTSQPSTDFLATETTSTPSIIISSPTTAQTESATDHLTTSPSLSFIDSNAPSALEDELSSGSPASTVSLSSLPSRTILSSSPTAAVSVQATNMTADESNETIAPSGAAPYTVESYNETSAPSRAAQNTLESYNETSAPSPSTSSYNSTTESVIGETTVPSLSTTDAESENTMPTWSPTLTISEAPSYSPTTPAPTMGPCDGDPCPEQLCRSPWGFCGEGEGYCNEDAVWSPDCPAETNAPTPTGSAADTFDIGDFIDYDPYDPDISTATSEPTKEPSSNEGGKDTTFIKPSGGKKPPPNKQPGSTASESSGNGKGEVVNEQSTSDTPAPNTPVPSEMPMTESPTPIPALSPDDPAATYFCGNDWIDANEVCDIRCPTAKSEDCPGLQSCYAFTRCNDAPPTSSPVSENEPANWKEEDDDSEAVNVATPSPASDVAITKPAHAAVAASSSGSSSTGTSSSEDPGCTGKPCEIVGECRSQFGFCGGSFIYCNDLSSWSIDKCGLLGTDENGETLLCDADAKDCPGGERVIRNPDKACEYFPCPVEEDTSSSLGGLLVPGPAPTLPELPKPTLPTIVDPKKPDFNIDFASFGSKPNSQTINIDESKPAKDPSEIVVIGNEDDSDEDQTYAASDAASSTEDGKNDPLSYGSSNFDNLIYEEWITGAQSGGCCAIAYMLFSFSSMLLTLILVECVQ